MSARKELVNCFNCSASGQVCDRTRHRCLKCLQTTNVCRGYPRDLQWLSGVKSRGKEKGKAFSVETSRGQWQSTTPINHAFVFKQGKPRKKRRQTSKDLSSADLLQASFPKPPTITESNDWCDLAGAGVEDDIFSIELPNSIWDGPDVVSEDLYDVTGTSTDWPSLTLSSPCTTVNNTISLMLQSIPGRQDANQVESETSNNSQYSDLTSQLLLPSLESSRLLTWYEQELCTVPLTSDFQENPLRCERVSLNGPKYLLHAVLAISMQHVYRANDQFPDESVAQTIISYKDSATQLCQKALIDAPGRLNTSVIDAILVLFTLDTLSSAEGPWKERLSTALRKIESLNDILGIASSSARLRAQLGLFIWWDCSVALVARSEPVFPPQYYDAILAHDDSATWSIFTLSGVPRDLFKYTRELASMAAEKEQIVGLKYVKFDLSRVTEISNCIRAYSVGQTEYPGAADNDELVQHWHDICNAGNAWKYALLLYVSRVFNWSRTTDSHLSEIISLSRLVLDSVRCCRADSPLQKQLLFPVFLAGSECVDPYGQDFVTLFCEDWYRKCRYIQHGKRLLPAERDKENQSWWCKVINLAYTPPGKVAFLVLKKWYPNRGENGTFDDRKVKLIWTDDSAPLELPSRLFKAQGNEVKLQWVDGGHPSKRCLYGLEKLHHALKDKPLTPFNEIVKQLVTSNNLNQIEPLDSFRPIRATRPDFQKQIKLDKFQAKVLTLMSNTPGGVTVIEVCPGAGKTHIAAEIDKVIADHDTQLGAVIHAYPSNEKVNSLVKEPSKSLGRSRRVIHLHSPGTEQQLTRHDLSISRPGDRTIDCTSQHDSTQGQWIEYLYVGFVDSFTEQEFNHVILIMSMQKFRLDSSDHLDVLLSVCNET